MQRDSVIVPTNSGKWARINSGDIVRFKYAVSGHETGSFIHASGEYCYIQLALEEAGKPIVIERYRSEIRV